MTMDIIYGDVTLTTNFLKYIKVFPYLHIYKQKDYIEIISLYNFFSKEFLKKDNKFNDDKVNSKNKDKKILFYLDNNKQKICYNNTFYKIIFNIKNLIKLIKDFFQEKIILLIEDIYNLHVIVFFSTIAKIPILYISINCNQHLNLEKIVDQGSGLTLSKKYFKENAFLNAIERTLNDNDKYLKNSQILAKKPPKSKGHNNTALRIDNTLDNYKVEK